MKAPRSRNTSRKGIEFHQVLLFVNARFHMGCLSYPCLLPYCSMLDPNFFNCMCMLAMFAFRIEEWTASRPLRRPLGSPTLDVAPPSYTMLVAGSRFSWRRRQLTKNVTGKPHTYPQARTMKGSMCPTCIEGAVGSIPTYMPARFSVKTLCNKSRSLYTAKKVSTPFKNTSNSNVFIVAICYIPNDIMDQASVLQVLREILPSPCLDLLCESSPLRLSVFHTLNKLLCYPPLVLKACPRLRSRQCRPFAVSAERSCGCCGKAARSAGDPSAAENIPAWRSAEQCRLWSHWTGFIMQILMTRLVMGARL